MFALCDNTGIAEEISVLAEKLYQTKKVPVTTYLSKINHEGAVRF
jgi:hypothetical protein